MRFAFISQLMAAMSFAQTDAEIASYPDFHQSVAKWGFTWEVFIVTTTDDKWDLPLFHITGSIADGPYSWSNGGE